MKKKTKILKPTPQECPQCGIKLILNGPGWGFCDNCCADIETIDSNKAHLYDQPTQDTLEFESPQD